MDEGNKIKDHFFDWSHLILVGVCTISFAVALVFSLEIPFNLALIYGLCPVGGVSVIVICLSCIFKWKPKLWRDHFRIVAENDSYTKVIKSLLFPLLLVILYFYIQRNEGLQFLFTTSPVTCEMTVHPCGSSYLFQTTDVWDAADLISQPAEDKVFIVTNIISEKLQYRGICPQTGAYCSSTNINPGKRGPKWLEKMSWTFSHELSRAAIWNPVTCQRPETSSCDSGVLYDNGIQLDSCTNDRFCNIIGWCPPIKLNDFSKEPKFQTENFTIFLDLRPSFPNFRNLSWNEQTDYVANYAYVYAKRYEYKRSVDTCVYHPNFDPYCPRFRVEDIITLAKNEIGEIADFAEIEAYGGQFKIEAEWSCRFDWGKDIFDCFPQFKFFNQANNNGKPKIFSKITNQNSNNRTVTYSLGISISISHKGSGRKILLFNVIMYAQFMYVSFAMIKGPFLWIIRCFIAFIRMVMKCNPTICD